jgi:hypothetical protein
MGSNVVRLMGWWVCRKSAAMAMTVALAACGVVGGEGAPVQTGQIVGGATRQVRDVRPVRGFLPRPDLLAAGASGEAALVYINGDANFGRYSRVLLEPIAIWTDPDSKLSALPPRDRIALANRAQARIYGELAKHCHMVRAPGPNTVRLRLALTDAEKSDAAVNTVATYAPYVSTAASVAAIAFNDGVSYFAGSASAEGYMTDARSGNLLWEVVDKRGGTGAFVKNTLNTSLDIDLAFDVWAQKIASRLQAIGTCGGNGRS